MLQGIGGLGAVGLVGAGSASADAPAADAQNAQNGGSGQNTNWDNYTKVVLDDTTESPSMVDIAPDGRVFYIERGEFGGGLEIEASVNVVHPEGPETETTTALQMTVYGKQEDGLLGFVLDSNFEETGWVYLFYSPTNEEIASNQEELDYLNEAGKTDELDDVPQSEAPVEPYNQLSRFTFEDGEIDPDSEEEILRVHTQRETCCHTGGDMHWGPDGEMLYLTTGDDTNPFQSNGYTPIDEREGRDEFNAQRTSANTADLRGKVLRIIPNEDGSYDIPDDNLFTEAGGYEAEIEDGSVRPEIYTMGHRNPYRAAVDDKTGTLYVADYGPDAGEWDAERGPPGMVEFNRATEAGFYGWPYFIGPNIPYVDGAFVDADNDQGYTFEPAGPFNPENPVNESPGIDGLKNLPKPQAAMIYYPSEWSALLSSVPEYAQPYLPDEAPWPNLTGGAPMAGPVYRPKESYNPDVALPDSYNGEFFIMEWNNNWIKTVSVDDSGSVTGISPFMPNTQFLRPMDMKTGPNGALYLVEWGSVPYDDPNPDSGIYRIDHDGLTTPAPAFADDAGGTVQPGSTTTVEATLSNDASSALESGKITLVGGGSDFEISAGGGTSFDSIAAGESQTFSWDVTVPGSASGEFELTARTTYTINNKRVQETTTIPLQVSGGGGSADVIEPGTTIELGGDTTGWLGRAPSSIEGATNPTLPLEVGATYTVEWTNVDGAPHDFWMLDSEGNQIEGTGTQVVNTEGQTASVEFTVSEQFAEYYCSIHPQAMRGEVTNGGGGGGGTGNETETTTPTEVPNGTATETPTDTTAGTETSETGGGDGTGEETTTSTPGFGIGSALTALGAGALIRKLRKD